MLDLYRRQVANHLEHKAEELQYFLAQVVRGATASLQQFRAGQKEIEKSATQDVRFGLSAFTNAMQALKDSFATATGDELPWSQIEVLRYGQFFYGIRNASTHDGNPIAKAWIEGHFWVLLTIVRYHNGKRIEIIPPQEEVPVMCLEFAADFCDLLIQLLTPHLGREDLRGSGFTIEQLDGYAASPQFPAEFRKLFLEKRGEQIAAIQASVYDPIDAAVRKLTECRNYAHAARSTWLGQI